MDQQGKAEQDEMLSQLALKATIADLELVRKELGRKSEKGHTHDCNPARQRSECNICVHMYTIYIYIRI